MKNFYILSIVLLYTLHGAAQVANSESFDGTTFVPTGWTDLLISGTNTWSRVTAGTFPTQAPHSGAGEAKFNSFSANSGVKALITPLIDYSGRAGAATSVSFWMYRDNGYNTTADKIDVYINTAANMTGATLLGTVNRAIGLAPTVASNGWYQYTFTIPTTYSTATNYIIFRGTSAYGNNIYIDDVSWNSYPPAIDMMAVSLVSPNGSFNCFSSSQSVSIQIKNNGSATINYATSPVVISASASYTAASTSATSVLSIPNFTINSGTLAASASQTVTITTSFDMSQSGRYSFNASTSVVGDGNTNNNAMAASSVIIVSRVSSYPYQVDFSALPSPEFLVQQVSGTGNWTNVLTGNLSNPTLAPVMNSANGFAYFNSYSFSSGTISNLVLPSFDFTGIASPMIDLYVSQDNGWSGSNDKLDILVSTNGGATWSASIFTIQRYNTTYTTAGWKLFSIPLTAYAGNSCVRLAIQATSAFGNNIAIDYLKVYNQASVLPVKLIDFTGAKLSESENILEWRTAEEVNTKLFQLQRSTDGTTFNTIHTENAAGNYTGSSYQYIDTPDESSSIYYYRLISVDNDNSFEIFKIVSLENNTGKTTTFTLFPNPTSGSTVLNLKSGDAGRYLVEINDMNGKRYDVAEYSIEPGQHELIINSDNLSTGVYFIKVYTADTGKDGTVQKLVKL